MALVTNILWCFREARALSLAAKITFIVSNYVLYCCTFIIYRLYLSPLAKFPGPKLAAITDWYETYFELLQGLGGQYTFQIQRLHKLYGM